jgi:hypothetical protein
MTPADRDAAVALANLRHAYKQAFDFHIGDQRTYAERLLRPAIKTLERALAERPTCATCRYYVPDPNPTEEGYCERMKLWRAQDWHCADHGLPSNEQTHCGECGYPWGEGVHTCPSR